MESTPAQFYHTRIDTHENLNPKMINIAIRVAIESTHLFDQKGFEE